MSRKLTNYEFIKRSMLIHGDFYDYSKVEYINSLTKVLIVCKLHGNFNQIPNNHLAGKGCVVCGNSKYDRDSFNIYAKRIHSNLDFTKFEYMGYLVKSKVICNLHGEWLSTPSNILSGSGCRICYNISITSNSFDFIKKSKSIHLDKYDYNLVDYKNSKKKVKIVCKKHGLFLQLPSSHLAGSGCNKCSIDLSKKKVDLFIIQSNIIHDNKYEYEFSNYINSKINISVFCKSHGIFLITPDNHLSGKGCPKCSKQSSKMEKKWIEDCVAVSKLNIKTSIILNIGGIIYKPDGYNEDTKTIYEFYGDYWHGNPIKYNSSDINKSCNMEFGELYRKTIIRENKLISMGYKVVSIWESDFKKNKKTE